MSHIKVFFIAKIKNLNDEYKQINKELYEIASTLPGFISLKSEEIDDIEITISSWKDQFSVDNWANNPIHIEAKKRATEWYHWVKGIHIEAEDEFTWSLKKEEKNELSKS